MPRSKFISQLLLPEMRAFLIAILPLLILSLIIFFQLPYEWGIGSFVISLIVLLLIFFSGLKAAKTRYSLTTERNQIRAIISNFTSPIIAYDQNFVVTAFNGAAEDLFKIKSENVLGEKISPEWASQDEFKILAQVVFPSLAPTMEFKSDPDEYPQIMDINFPDPYLELTVTTVRVRDSFGRILGFFKLVQDRTREEQLISSKSEFLTVAAHQLRTPLSAIRWTFESAIKGDFGEMTDEQKKALQSGLLASEKVLKTANDLLDIANIESGKFGYNFVENNILEVAREIIKSYQLLASEHNIKIYLDSPKEGIPNFLFDAIRIRIVFQNIIENAIRYNVENGEIVIKMEIKGEYLEISIKDTGIGIPEKEMPKLFSKFFRASNVVKHETEGTGLGLYIAKNIIEAHGGSIRADSIENRGSTFYFTIPMSENLIPKRSKAR